MLVQQITRRYVDTVFDVARLPVGALQLVARRGDDAAWPPRLVFASFEGEAKQALGALLSDDLLVAEGRIEAARVADLREAVRLEEQADRLRQEADADFERRMRVEEERRVEADADAARHQRAADQERARAEQQAAEKAQRARRDAREAAERRDAVLKKQKRADRLATINEEKAALRQDEQATRASAEVGKVDRKIQASKKARTAKKAPARSTRRPGTSGRSGSPRSSRS
jgi:fused signal recognition particle receptor